MNYLMNRVNAYPITNEAKTRELNIIQDILHNNEYNKNLSIRPKTTKTQVCSTKKQNGIFLHIAEKRQRKSQNIVRPHTQIYRYEKSGVYQMRCMDCPLKYIGQTG
jgi:hypothetical protein